MTITVVAVEPATEAPGKSKSRLISVLNKSARLLTLLISTWTTSLESRNQNETYAGQESRECPQNWS